MLINLKGFSCLLILLLFLPIPALAFDSFDCVGTEPSWRLSLTEHKFTFAQKDAADIKMPSVEAKSAKNMSIDHIRVFRTNMNNKNVIIIIQKQSCTDGTSRDVFPYEGLFITSNDVFHGCCSKKILLTH